MFAQSHSHFISRSIAIVFLAFVSAGTLVACGGGEARKEVVTSAQNGAITIKTPAGQTRFDIDRINAAAGPLTVTYVNESTSAHNFMIHDLDGVASSDAQSTSEATFTLEVGKTYQFFCALFSHEAQGMKGTIVVS